MSKKAFLGGFLYLKAFKWSDDMVASKNNSLKEKNLLIVTGHFPDKNNKAIGNVFVKEQLKYIKKRFNKVLVVVPTPRNPSWLSSLARLFPESLFPTYSKVKADNLFRDYSYDNVFVKYLKYWHWPIDTFRCKAGLKFFRMIDSYIKSKKTRFSIVHSHFSYPAGFAGNMLGKKLGIPSIITIHESADWFKSERETKDMNLKYSWSEADALIRVSNRDIASLESFTTKDKLFYIANGFDAKKFYPHDKKESRKKLGLPINKKIFVNVAALTEYKNHDNLIDAIRIAVKKKKDLLCVIIGGGPLKETLENKIKSINLENNIRIVGIKPHAEIPLWMSAADAFVLSSDEEGNPTVMFEALGCGRPYVGTIAGGVADVITSDNYGLLCPLKDHKALARIIIKACGINWSEKKIYNYSRNYTWENIADQIEQVYIKLLKNKKRAKGDQD